MQKWTIFINYFICSRFSYEMEFVLIFWFVFRAKCAISGGGRAPNVQNNQFTLNCLLYYQIQNHARLFFSCYLLLRMLFEVRWNGKNLVAVHVLCMYLYEYVLGNISCTRDDTRGRYLVLMICSQYSVLLWCSKGVTKADFRSGVNGMVILLLKTVGQVRGVHLVFQFWEIKSFALILQSLFIALNTAILWITIEV